MERLLSTLHKYKAQMRVVIKLCKAEQVMLKKIQGLQTDLSTFRFLLWVRDSMIPIALMQGFMYLLVLLQAPAWASLCSGALQKGPCRYPCWCKDPMGSQTCPEGWCAAIVLQTGPGTAIGLQSWLWSGCSRPVQGCFLYWRWRCAKLSGQPARLTSLILTSLILKNKNPCYLIWFFFSWVAISVCYLLSFHCTPPRAVWHCLPTLPLGVCRPL